MTAKAEINWAVFDALMQFKVTLKFVAHELGVAERTLQRHVETEKGMTFEQYHELKLNRTGVKLQQKAIEMALSGDRTMMIFCLKNLAKWTDKVEQTVDVTEEAKQSLKLAYNLEVSNG